jgi:heme-degrading monooxygenase HmoA
VDPSSGDGVIVRVLRANVRAGRVAPFNALFRRQLALLREQRGLAYVKLARRLQADGSEEAVLFEEWEDAVSLYAWVGPNLAEPRLLPGVRELVDEIHVAHYEVLSEDGESLTGGASEPAPGDVAETAGGDRDAAGDGGQADELGRREATGGGEAS